MQINIHKSCAADAVGDQIRGRYLLMEYITGIIRAETCLVHCVKISNKNIICFSGYMDRPVARWNIYADLVDTCWNGDFLPFLAVPDREVQLIAQRHQVVKGHAGEIHRIRGG